MATQKQIEANRRNAQKSTGPKSPSGKDRSRCNSVQHGLAGTGVVVPESMAVRVNEAEARWYVQNQRDPATASDREKLLVRSYVVEAIRAQKAISDQFSLEIEVRKRACESWVEERWLQAVEVARSLRREPEWTIRRVRQTDQGCAWLIQQWECLAEDVANQGCVEEADWRHYLDLAGIDPDRRAALLPGDLDNVLGDIQNAIANLTQYREEVLAPRDKRERENAIYGIAPDSKDLRRLKRYESESYRRMVAAERELKALLSGAPASPPPTPSPRPTPGDTAPKPALAPPAPPPRWTPSPALAKKLETEQRPTTPPAVVQPPKVTPMVAPVQGNMCTVSHGPSSVTELLPAPKRPRVDLSGLSDKELASRVRRIVRHDPSNKKLLKALRAEQGRRKRVTESKPLESAMKREA